MILLRECTIKKKKRACATLRGRTIYQFYENYTATGCEKERKLDAKAKGGKGRE
jgi:hypothetical protein